MTLNHAATGNGKVTRTSATAVSATNTLRVALLANLAKNAPLLDADAPHDALAELESEKSVAAYEAALSTSGIKSMFRKATAPCLPGLRRFNRIFVSMCAKDFAATAARRRCLPCLKCWVTRYSGPTPLAAAITNDKPTTKRILHYYGLPTPLFQVFESRR